MSRLILYSRPDCHLCNVAADMLHATGLGESYQKVNIETELQLLKRYSIRVPVLLRKDNQQELFWPFDHQELAAFMDLDR